MVDDEFGQLINLVNGAHEHKKIHGELDIFMNPKDDEWLTHELKYQPMVYKVVPDRQLSWFITTITRVYHTYNYS